MARLQGKIVFITGASSGIGAALARRVAAEGAVAAITARRMDRLTLLADEIRVAGGRALPLEADVTRDGDVERAAVATRDAFGGIDVVVANAGFGVAGRLDRLEMADYRHQLETNVFGVLRTVYATLDDLKRSKGCLAVMGSVAAHVPGPGTSAYAMSKAAVRSLALSLRAELAEDDVSVVLISPGFVDSEIRRVDNQGHLHEGGRDALPSWLRMPSDRAAAEIVDAIVHRERERVLTLHGKAAVGLMHHAPGLVSWIGAKIPRRKQK